MTKPPRIRSSFRLVVRLLMWTAVVVALAVGGGFWLATRSWFIVAQATPVLEERLGGDVSIGNARYLGRGFFEFTDVGLRARGLEGEAAEIARIGLVSVEVDPDLLLRGGVQVLRIGLENVLLRLSEDSNDSGVFNFMSLTPRWDTEAEATTLPGRISIHNAIIQMGAHVRGGYAERGHRRVSGIMQTLRGDDQWYQFLLHEIDSTTYERIDGGLKIGGRWNATTYEYESEVNGVVLDERSAEMCPQNVRLWWEKMAPSGRVSNAKLAWNPRDGMTVELTLDVFALTFPIEAEDMWVRYRDGGIEAEEGLPRMRVREGRIRLDRDSLQFEHLVGVLDSATEDEDVVGVPYQVSARLGSLSSFSWETRDAWMSQVLETAPFWLHLKLDEFSLAHTPEGRGEAVELPLAVARVLQTFRMSGWNLATEIEVRRDPPRVDPETGALIAGDTYTWGEACIEQGSGAYERFSYRLDDITAHIEFDDDFVTLHEIHGYGAGDCVVDVSGEIRSLAHGDVAVHVKATDMELDDRLREALQPAQQRAYDAFLSRSAEAALIEAGLLRESADAAAPPRKPGSAWPFRIGGRVDLDLTLTRTGGYDSPTIPTGRMDIDWIGVLYERFPYPVTVSGGAVVWEADRLWLTSGRGAPADEGLTILTPGGGEGSIRGEVGLTMQDGQTVLEPDISVELVHDRLNDLLYSAVPLSADETDRLGENSGWPGRTRTRAADFMRQVFRSGDLSYSGRVFTDETRELQYDFQVQLRNASARPTAEFAGVIGAPDAFWPDGFGIENGRGDLRITPAGIELESFQARHGTGQITASGLIVPDEHGQLDTRLHVTFDQLHLGPYLLSIVPSDWSARANDLWSRYKPEGSFRAELDLEKSAAGNAALAIRLTPEELRLVVNEQPLRLERERGHLLLQRGRVVPENLSLAAWIGDQAAGHLELDAPTDMPRGDAAPLELTWRGGAFESPLVREAMRLSGAASLLEQYETLRPFGQFDAHVRYTQPDMFGRGGYAVALRPQSLGLQVKGTPILAQFDPGSEVEFREGVLTVNDVRGRHGGGTFRANGTVDTNGAMDVDMALSAEGPLRSEEVWSLLPGPVRTVLDGIDYQDGEEARLVGGHLRMTQDDAVNGTRQWRMAFDGRVETRGASLDVGLAFKDLDGAFDISVARAPGQAPQVEVIATARSVQAGRDFLTNLYAPIRLAPDGRAVEISELRANMYGGALAGRLQVGIMGNPDYHLNIDIVGASLNEMYAQLSQASAEDGETADEAASGTGPVGTIFANIGIRGRRGEEGSRVGRGAVRIMDGKFARVLFSLRVIQALQLTLPLQHDYFDFASLDFYLENDRIVFDDEILLESGFGDIASLQLLGTGWMDADTFELNTRFKIRTGLLVMRELAGGIGDNLFVIELTGPIFEPVINIIPLPGIGPAQDSAAASARYDRPAPLPGEGEEGLIVTVPERSEEE